MVSGQGAPGRPANGDTARKHLATRHLCAGAYFDSDFRGVLLRQVYNDSTRMIAPSYRFDLVSVLHQAWRAWTLETAQHAGVLTTLAIGLRINPPAVVAVICWLALWQQSRALAKNALTVLPLHAKAAADRWLRRTRWRSDLDELRQQTRLLRLNGFSCVVLALTPPLVAGISRTPLGDLVAAAALLALPIVLIVGGRGMAEQLCLNHVSKVRDVCKLRPRRLSRRQQAIYDQQDHPYVVYRRPSPPEEGSDQDSSATKLPEFDLIDEGESPFVGSGELVHRWLPPLTVQLLRPGSETDKHKPMREREPPKPPSAHQLVEHLRKEMRPLSDDHDPKGLRGFFMNDRLYVAEADVQSRPEWLLERPSSRHINEIIDDPYGDVHHFLEIGAGATGELVTTVFLRVTVKGRALSLDFAACALTRTPTEYHRLDGYAETDVVAVVRSAWRRFCDLPAEVAGTWRLAEAPLLLTQAVRARKNRMLKPRRGMAIGAQLSVRELKSTPWKYAQLDKVIIHDHVKLIEQRLLTAVEDFLGDKGIDTSAFRKKAMSIINTGVLNMGGRTEINQSAVGTNSQVRTDSREDPGGGSQPPSTSDGGQ
ncbi:hypothetical protein OG320_27300 [Microbispora sp. NBC_01189]|uniref:hypothetical protein n=1 Tax=Microbispora sp. NBC_01189 TaxID=2903583 RepID=UPI002E11F0B5|nr:hypothetical protein OG320_27300 [Microbispora sp. NBC_01189]